MAGRAISSHPYCVTILHENLKAWRERLGLTLEKAAERVAVVAESEGIDPKSKKVPRTYVSLSRWERGKVDVKEIGLELIAKAYGMDVDRLRRPPPPEHEPPSRQVKVPHHQADAVEAFIKALNDKPQ